MSGPSRRDICLSGAGMAVAGLAGASAARAVDPPPLLAPPRPRAFDIPFEGRRWRIQVVVPRGMPPAGGWPAVWTTDADLMFGTLTEAVQALGRRTDLPRPAVAIGIGYPDGSDIRIQRALDLTPFGGPGNGGADRLLDCIAQRLMPLLARRFGLAPGRHALFGHSLGGLLALHALATRPGLFAAHVAASPSVWFADRAILETLERARVGLKGRLLVTVGSQEQTSGPIAMASPRAKELAAIFADQRQVDGAREVAAMLNGVPGLTVAFRAIDGEDHGTVVPAAIARGVRFALYPELD